MKSNKAAWIAIAALMLESAVIVSLPARIPRAPRMLTALVNVLAAAALFVALRQRRSR